MILNRYIPQLVDRFAYFVVFHHMLYPHSLHKPDSNSFSRIDITLSKWLIPASKWRCCSMSKCFSTSHTYALCVLRSCVINFKSLLYISKPLEFATFKPYC